MKKLVSIFIFFQLSFATSSAQTVDIVLSKLEKQYANSININYSLKYNLYKNSSSNTVYESYLGVYKKNKLGEVYQKINNTEYILKGNFLLKVMHDDKVIEVSESKPFGVGTNTMKALLDYCKVENFKATRDGWQLTLEPKENPELEYSKIIIVIDKTYRIKKQKFYYNNAIDFSNNFNKSDVSLPVLEIIYSNYNNSIAAESFFHLKKFINFNGKKVSKAANFSKYTLEDYR